MTRAPGLAAIHAAELKVARSGRDALDSMRRARVAFRASLARRSTLALAAGAAGLLGFWAARRPTARVGGVAATAPVAGLALAFIARFAMQHVPFILALVWRARRNPAGANDR